MTSASAAPAQSREHPLDQTQPGRWARITRMEASNGKLHRLMAMGVCTGREIKLVQAGNPLIIRVMNTRIGLSRELAKGIHVQTCERPSAAGSQASPDRALEEK